MDKLVTVPVSFESFVEVVVGSFTTKFRMPVLSVVFYTNFLFFDTDVDTYSAFPIDIKMRLSGVRKTKTFNKLKNLQFFITCPVCAIFLLS